MFENSSSRTLPLPYPTLPSYKTISSSLPTYQLPPINIPVVKREDEIPIISIPKPVTPPLIPIPTTQQLLRQQLPQLPQLTHETHEHELADQDQHHHLHHHQHQQQQQQQRKKRQCPDCKLYFSNLATHKSTHLSISARPHICLKCSRGFARSNDLIRHENSHLKDVGKFLYKCPFYQGECHSNGCFSRCDTFKNHLKALHFLYPAGTKKKDRSKVNGECKLCGAFFNNVDEWLKLHIDTNLCTKICNR